MSVPRNVSITSWQTFYESMVDRHADRPTHIQVERRPEERTDNKMMCYM